MALTVPDKGEGANDIQSIFFQEYLDAIMAGIAGTECVLVGCGVTANNNMAPSVAKGAVLSQGVMFPVTAGTVTIGAADATNPRIDLIVVNSSGTKAVRAGTAAAAPKPPARSAGDVLLGVVYVAANDTSIGATEITDGRVLRTQGPICIYKTIAAETTNTTTSAIHILNKTGSGVVIPNGLFLTGRVLRVRIGGNMLLNSGTPTVTLTISYGGTTLFADTSAAAVADTDRRPFFLTFDFVAHAANDQNLSGHFEYSDIVAAITAPTTGIGDAFPAAANREGGAAFGGSGTVDSDAADRTLAVTLTFNVSNSAVEALVQSATVELI